jgi:cytochrome P450
VLKTVTFIAWDSAIFRISPLLGKMATYLIPADVNKATLNHVAQSKAKILARMNRGELETKDFCSYIFKIKEEMGLNDWHMAAYSNALIVAGSETTATTMSTLTYWLCRTPRVYDKLKEEVRSRFKTSSEINSLSATFPYLTAIIHEVLRIFPPIPIGMQRIAPKAGAMVSGVFVPEGVSPCSYLGMGFLTESQTTVSVHAWSATRNERNFKDPDSFIPERWLGLDPNTTDTFSASQPFLLGTRGCLGQK